MTAAVSVPVFDGPLGLLLELVERNKLEITTISVAAITTEYIERLNDSANQRDMAQFVELAARLVFIKSVALLPPSSIEDETSPQAELHQLNQELDDYRQMRDAARLLEQRVRRNLRTHSRPHKAIVTSAPLPLPQFELSLLASAFQDALKKAQPVHTLTASKKVYDQEKIVKQLVQEISRGPLRLSVVIGRCHDRLEIIVTFVALLEMVKAEQVIVRQSTIFDEIHLEAPHD